MNVDRGSTATLPVEYRDWTGALVDPVDPVVRITDPTGVVVVAAGTPTQDATGVYHYDYAVAAGAPLGLWDVEWSGVIDGADAGTPDEFLVTAGVLQPAPSGSGLCSLWLEVDDPRLCCPDADEVELLLAIEAACVLLYRLSGRQFPGVCEDVVRPGNPWPDVQYLASSDGRSRPIAMSAGDGWVGLPDGLPGGCWPRVRLPGYPVRSVTEVKVDGVVLDPTTYRLVDRRYLVRASGTWPMRQHLGLADTEPGTWSVSYVYGRVPDAGGVVAAATLACELLAACNGGECALPDAVQSIVREGVSMQLVPVDGLEAALVDGRTGVPVVDRWLRSVNPHGVDRPAKVLTPGLGTVHRS